LEVIKLSLLTIEQAAAYLQMNPQVVRRWLRKGKLPGFKMGQEWRIDEKDLAALIEDAKAKQQIEE
jgi:excisionase family DNA binding protein